MIHVAMSCHLFVCSLCLIILLVLILKFLFFNNIEILILLSILPELCPAKIICRL
jgi:hypothetical protein